MMPNTQELVDMIVEWRKTNPSEQAVFDLLCTLGSTLKNMPMSSELNIGPITTQQLTHTIRNWGKINRSQEDVRDLLSGVGMSIKHMTSVSKDFAEMVVDDLGELTMKIEDLLMPITPPPDLPSYGGYYSTIGPSDQPRSKQ